MGAQTYKVSISSVYYDGIRIKLNEKASPLGVRSKWEISFWGEVCVWRVDRNLRRLTGRQSVRQQSWKLHAQRGTQLLDGIACVIQRWSLRILLFIYPFEIITAMIDEME